MFPGLKKSDIRYPNHKKNHRWLKQLCRISQRLNSDFFGQCKIKLFLENCKKNWHNIHLLHVSDILKVGLKIFDSGKKNWTI